MLQKFMLSQNKAGQMAIHFITFMAVCAATFGFLMCCVAFVIVRVDTPDYVLIPLTTAILTCSAFMDSFLLSKVFKENGRIIGLCTALIFVFFVLVVSFSNKSFALTNILLSKVCAIAFAGLLGGILGVNT